MKITPAVAYFRTSSAVNVRGDSETRQRLAVDKYARGARYSVSASFYDAAVSGADAIDARPGFMDMLNFCRQHDIRAVLVENASRLARDLVVQEVAYARLSSMGIAIIPVDSPEHFISNSPTAALIRQVLGAFAEFDKASTVAKLRAARDRKSAALGKRVEGRKPLATPEMVKEAKRLARRNPKTKRVRSLRTISKALAKLGYTRPDGTPLHAQTVANML